MITLTLREVIAASNALPKVGKLPLKPSHNLGVIRNRLKPLLKVIGERERESIEERGGKIDDLGRITWPAPKDGETAPDVAHRKAFDEYLDNTEETIDREPIKLADCLGTDPTKQYEIEPEILSVLEKIIVE